MTTDNPVRSVAIVGSGSALWLAAIALHRAFAALGLTVKVVETPSTSPPQDVIATLPELARFHRLLGITEGDVLRQCDATFTLGQQFIGWSGGESAFLHAYGETGEAVGELPFMPLWARAHNGGLRVAFEAFCLTGAGARLGRLDPAAPHGYHLDHDRYQALLARHAVNLGIEVRTDPAPSVEADNGQIKCIRLSDGYAIEADLYIDASGGEGALIATIDPQPTLMPGRASPCDRLLVASASALGDLPLYSRIAAHRAGWIGLFPLASRTGIAFAYASNAMSDAEAVGTMRAHAGVTISGDIGITSIAERIRQRPWIANCVAVGNAMAAGDPIDAATLHRNQIAVTHLVSLLPVDRDNMIEADIFNETVVTHLMRLRDFQATHYRLNKRIGDAFWDAARAAPISRELAAKIDLFAARAMLAQYNDETFNADSWHALLIGHGIVPRSWDPQADTLADADLIAALQGILAKVKRTVDAMMTHQRARVAA